MRLMIIGRLEGHISEAGKIAIHRGAKVIHCEDTAQAIGALLNGKGADLVMIDVKQNIREFIDRLEEERIHMPVIACGVNTDARSAVKAIQDGAKEYVPLPPDAELIAGEIERDSSRILELLQGGSDRAGRGGARLDIDHDRLKGRRGALDAAHMGHRRARQRDTENGVFAIRDVIHTHDIRLAARRLPS